MNQGPGQPRIHDAELLKSKRPYDEIASELVESCQIFEPWVYGTPRFHGGPLVLADKTYHRLYETVSRVGKLYQELVDLVWKSPDLLDSFYGLSPYQKLLWLSSGGCWHGFARFDVFICEDDSVQICEINADTPTGQIDALAIGELVAKDFPGMPDTMEPYRDLFLKMAFRYHAMHVGREERPSRVGIIYPTDICEDIMLIQLYTSWFEEEGIEVVTGSPFNLVAQEDKGLALFGKPIDMILRHYKTDWWAEQRPVWINEPPVPDPDPLHEQVLAVVEAEQARKVSIINPMGSLIPQNKLSMAFFWEYIHLFSPDSQDTIRLHMPPSWRVETVGRERLCKERESWVLKSDFGCEGEEVVVGPYTDQDDWEESLSLLTEGNWIAQRFFKARGLEEGHIPNYGVYLIAGEPAGILTRMDPPESATGHEAVVPPTFLKAPITSDVEIENDARTE